MPSVIIETDYIDADEVAWLTSRDIQYNIWKSPVAVWVPDGGGNMHETYPMVAFEIEFTSDQQAKEFQELQDRHARPSGGTV